MPIELKGSSFTLSVVHLYEARPDVIRQALKAMIAKAPSFLKYAPIVVNVSRLSLPINWQLLQQAICSTGLRIVGISDCKNDALKAEINRSGLALMTEGKEKYLYSTPKENHITPLHNHTTMAQIKKTILIDSPVRSGQQVYASCCDLVVTSNVSAGAELIADGNIHVYGVMHGRMIAGARGDRDMQIFCTNLAAELVSIAGIYCLSDQIPNKFYGKAVRLRLAHNNTLNVLPLN